MLPHVPSKHMLAPSNYITSPQFLIHDCQLRHSHTLARCSPVPLGFRARLCAASRANELSRTKKLCLFELALRVLDCLSHTNPATRTSPEFDSGIKSLIMYPDIEREGRLLVRRCCVDVQIIICAKRLCRLTFKLCQSMCCDRVFRLADFFPQPSARSLRPSFAHPIRIHHNSEVTTGLM